MTTTPNTSSYTNYGTGNGTSAVQEVPDQQQDSQGLSLPMTESHSLLRTHTATATATATAAASDDHGLQDGVDLEAGTPADHAATATATSTSTATTAARGHRHRRTGSRIVIDTIVEGMEFLAEQVTSTTDDWKEAAHDAAQAAQTIVDDVTETLVDDLTTYDDGDAILLDMGLTRNLSILPSDIEDVATTKDDAGDLKTTTPQTILPEVKDNFYCCPDKIQDCCRPTNSNILMDSPPPSPSPVVVVVKKAVDEEMGGELKPLIPTSNTTAAATTAECAPPPAVPFHAYLTLVGAVVCLSSIGPSLKMQKGVESSALKIYWRMTGTYMVLFPLAVRSVCKKDRSSMPKLTASQWCTFGLAACCYAIMCVAFVLALEYTSVGNVVIFSNSQSILLLLGKAFMGDPISWMESSGAFTAFVGAALCASSDSSPDSVVQQDMAWAGWGVLLALLSATGGVGYLVFAKTLREHVPSVFCFMFMIMLGGSFCVLMFMTIVGTHYTWDRDLHTGLWGFLDWHHVDRLPLEIWMVVICNIGGALGYVRAMAYFDNLIISVATLMEPVVASLMAVGLHVGVLPNSMGWMGNLLVVAGTVAVIYPSSTSQGKQAPSGGGH